MSTDTRANIWVFLEALGRYRGLIVGLTLAAALVAVAVSLVLPEWYMADALVLPSQDSGSAGLARLTQVASLTGDARYPGMITPHDVYARMLRSRRLADRVIERLGLVEKYKVLGVGQVYPILEQRTSFRVTDEGLLRISAEARNAADAAELTRTYVEELIQLSKELLSTSARDKREFIEHRLSEVSGQLDTARGELEAFQLKYRAVDFDEQTRLVIDQASALKVRIANYDLEIQMLSPVLSKNNPDLSEKIRRRDLVQKQLDELEWGGSDSSFFSLPVASMPGLKGVYESLYSRVQVNETLYRSLLEMYERSRIQEQEIQPAITVLDWPIPPDLRSRPQRSIIVVSSAILTMILAVFLALVFDYVRRLREQQPNDYRRLMVFADAFFGWLPGVRKSNKA